MKKYYKHASVDQLREQIEFRFNQIKARIQHPLTNQRQTQHLHIQQQISHRFREYMQHLQHQQRQSEIQLHNQLHDSYLHQIVQHRKHIIDRSLQKYEHRHRCKTLQSQCQHSTENTSNMHHQKINPQQLTEKQSKVNKSLQIKQKVHSNFNTQHHQLKAFNSLFLEPNIIINQKNNKIEQNASAKQNKNQNIKQNINPQNKKLQSQSKNEQKIRKSVKSRMKINQSNFINFKTHYKRQKTQFFLNKYAYEQSKRKQLKQFVLNRNGFEKISKLKTEP